MESLKSPQSLISVTAAGLSTWALIHSYKSVGNLQDQINKLHAITQIIYNNVDGIKKKEPSAEDQKKLEAKAKKKLKQEKLEKLMLFQTLDNLQVQVEAMMTYLTAKGDFVKPKVKKSKVSKPAQSDTDSSEEDEPKKKKKKPSKKKKPTKKSDTDTDTDSEIDDDDLKKKLEKLTSK